MAAPRRELPPAASGGYFQTRDVALRMGLDAIGSPRAGNGHGALIPPTYRDLLDALTGPAAGASTPPLIERLPNM
jgi:hypothetical protein